MRLLGSVVRSTFKVVVLFSALVLTPLLAFSHFSASLAGMLGGFADNYLPRPTLLSAEKKSRAKSDARLHDQRVLDKQERATKRRAAAAGNKVANNKGRRVLQRGAGALAVGWIPVIGVTADVVSLSADYADVCALFATIDEMSLMLYLPESSLYTDNYCDVPEQGIEIIKESAGNTHFPWDIEGSQ
jgi:hypothetical protein